MVMEVGKSRLEALGEVEETADLLDYYANDMEKNQGYIRALGKVNPDDPTERNQSVLKPYGVWVVISPFNFPMALSGAPIAAALVTGNTVVFKGASTTLYTGWKTAELFADAGLPPGVFNYVSGPGRTVGQELQDNPAIAGWTFTGSYEVGMQVARNALSGAYPRPAVIEMGGKNPTIVSKHADLGKAASGVVRSAFGLDGQKCSACSRVYVEAPVYDAFVAQIVALTGKLKVGDPTAARHLHGDGHRQGRLRGLSAVHHPGAPGWAGALRRRCHHGWQVWPGLLCPAGHHRRPGRRSPAGETGTLPADSLSSPKWTTMEEAMRHANATTYGLTAGFFSEDEQEIQWFLDNIQAGTIYANRASGATTGAWPGVQAFGGWKGSGMSGKGVGSFYSLPLYMHEQSQTVFK